MYQIKDLNTQTIKGGFYHQISDLKADYIEQLSAAFREMYENHLPESDFDEILEAFLNSSISDTTDTLFMMHDLDLLEFEFVKVNETSYLEESEKIHETRMKVYDLHEDDLFYNPYVLDEYL